MSQSSTPGAGSSSSGAAPPPVPPPHTRPRAQPPSTIPLIRAWSDSPEVRYLVHIYNFDL